MNKLKRFSILFLVLLSFSCSLFGKPTRVAYLIPEGFTGGVIILYNQPDGITPETANDGTVLYRIPKDGFLKVKPALQREAFKFNFYFVDDKDKVTLIEYVYPKYHVRSPGDTTSKSFDTLTEDEQTNKTFAMFHETTNFNISGEKVYLHSFIVGKPMNALNIYTETENKVFDIQERFLKVKAKFNNE